MAVGDVYVFPGFLIPVLTQFFRKKSHLNRGSNSQPPGHESNTLTNEPPGRGPRKVESIYLFIKQQNFRIVQNESIKICRCKNKCDSKIKICFGKGRKHCGKRRKCWLPASSPFPTMFSKGFLYRVVKSCDCVVKSYFKTQSCVLVAQSKKLLEISEGTGENAPNQLELFYFSHIFFLPSLEQIATFQVHLFCCLKMLQIGPV